MVIDTLLSAAHLKHAIGDELFAALISSDNTEVVRAFAATLVTNRFSTEMTVGGRTYEILPVLLKDEEMDGVNGKVIVERAEKMNANNGKSACERLLRRQQDIPFALRGRICIAFTNYRHPRYHQVFHFIRWNQEEDRWVKDQKALTNDYPCGREFRVLRRKSIK